MTAKSVWIGHQIWVPAQWVVFYLPRAGPRQRRPGGVPRVPLSQGCVCVLGLAFGLSLIQAKPRPHCCSSKRPPMAYGQTPQHHAPHAQHRPHPRARPRTPNHTSPRRAAPLSHPQARHWSPPAPGPGSELPISPPLQPSASPQCLHVTQ
jgi:hypothetical protein